MKCKVCDYRLWNLSGRTCPECGTPFRPSEFTFAPNAVAFCCPHCDQSYYGWDEQGHLVPRQFTCVGCDQAIDMDVMVLRPAREVDEQQTLPERNPWVTQPGRGTFRAWWHTVGAAMGRPGRLLRVTPRTGVWPAWTFALISLAVTALANAAGLGLLFILPGMALGGGALSGGMLLPVAFIGIGHVAVVVVLLGVWGLLTQGLLRLGGRPAAGFGRTYQALCYSHGVTVVSAVPCLGSYLLAPAWVWWAVSAVFAVKEAQQVSGPRAAAAVLTPPSIVVLGLVAVLVYAVMSLYTSVSNIPFGGSGVGLQKIHRAFHLTTQQHGGQLPDHPGELLLQTWMSPHDFIDFGNSATSLADVPLGQHDLDTWHLLSAAEQRAAVQAAASARPADDAPYRFGDYVFTYHGLDLHQHPGHLWIAIGYPDPRRNAGPGQIHVLQIDGSSPGLSATEFANALQDQNSERAMLGLPPIPDPATIRHPARGP